MILEQCQATGNDWRVTNAVQSETNCQSTDVHTYANSFQSLGHHYFSTIVVFCLCMLSCSFWFDTLLLNNIADRLSS